MSRHLAIAELVLAEYAGELPVAMVLGPLRVSSAPGGGLIVGGSDDRGDWISNARFLPRFGPGASGRLYHRGILDDARVVYGYCLGARPAWLAGHSRAAGIVAIVGASLRIETVTLAQPRVLWLGPDLPDATRFVTSYCRTDDSVCWLPPRWLGWRHIGRVLWGTPRARHFGEDHSMRHYRDGMINGMWA